MITGTGIYIAVIWLVIKTYFLQRQVDALQKTKLDKPKGLAAPEDFQ